MKKKTFLGLLALLIVCGLVLAAAIGSSWFTNKNFKTWFNSWGNGVQSNVESNDYAHSREEAIAFDEDGNYYSAYTVYSMPRSLTFIDKNYQSVSGNSVIFHATILPENADNQCVTWESDCPEVVSVTPMADGSATATITRLTPLTFGTVTITCKSVVNPEIFATCRIEQLIRGGELSVANDSVFSHVKFCESFTYDCFYEVSPGSGTILGELTNVQFSIELTNSFLAEIDYQLEDIGSNPYCLVNGLGNVDGDGTTVTMAIDPYYSFADFPDLDMATFNRAFKLACYSYNQPQPHAIMTVSADYVFNGEVYDSLSCEVELYFDVSNIWVSVTGVNIGNDFVFVE